jgi:hypothetical protein
MGTVMVDLHCRVDDFLLAQQKQTADDLVTQFGLEFSVVQTKQSHEVGGKVGGEFGIAVGAMSNKVDQLAKTDQALGVGRARSLHEELQESLVLAVLVVEVILV